MKVGIWIPEGFDPSVGGGASYLDRLLREIDVYPFSKEVEICYITRLAIDYHFQKTVIRLPHLNRELSLQEKIICRIPSQRNRIYAKAEERRLNAEHIRDIRFLTDNQVGFIVYPTQLCREIDDYPFVAMNWDIGHWSTFAFPELCAEGEYEERCSFYTEVLPKALITCCESEAGKQELLRFTNINAEKIHVVPLFAGNCVKVEVPEKQQEEILRQYGLVKNQFFFYPAQFWAHKNHVTIIKAFAAFLSTNPGVKLVLTGSDKGNLKYIQGLISEKGLMGDVIFPGFVPQGHINTFYKNAISLVMASTFGPTNMPPLEAMELDCPIIASDLSGHREQLNDAAIYFNPLDASSLAMAMNRVYTNRSHYVEAVQKQGLKTPFTIHSAMAEFSKALDKAVTIRSLWPISNV